MSLHNHMDKIKKDTAPPCGINGYHADNDGHMDGAKLIAYQAKTHFPSPAPPLVPRRMAF